MELMETIQASFDCSASISLAIWSEHFFAKEMFIVLLTDKAYGENNVF